MLKLHEIPFELHTVIVQYLQPYEIPIYLSINKTIFHTPIYWDYLVNIHFKDVYLFYKEKGLNSNVFPIDNKKSLSDHSLNHSEEKYDPFEQNDHFNHFNHFNPSDQPVNTDHSDKENHNKFENQSPNILGREFIPYFICYWKFYFLEYYSYMLEKYGVIRWDIPKPTDFILGNHKEKNEIFKGFNQQHQYRTGREQYYIDNAIIKYNIFENQLFLNELRNGNPRAIQVGALFITVMRKYPYAIPQLELRTLKSILTRLYELRSKNADKLISIISRFVVARAKIVNSHGISKENPLDKIRIASIPYYSFAMMLSKQSILDIPNWKCEKKYKLPNNDYNIQNISPSSYFETYKSLKFMEFHSNDNLKIEAIEHQIEDRLEENKKIRLVQEMAWLECFGESESSHSYFGTLITIAQYLFIKHLLKRNSFESYSSDNATIAWKTTSLCIGVFLFTSFSIGYLRWNPFIHPIRLIGCLIFGSLWAWVIHIKNLYIDLGIFSTVLIIDTILPFALLYRFGSYSFEPYHMFHPLGLIWFRIIMLAISLVIQTIPALDFISEFLKSAGTLLPLLIIEIFQFLLCFRPFRKFFISSLRKVFKSTRRLEYFLLYVETCREQSSGINPDLLAIWISALFISHIIYGFIYLWLHVYSYNLYITAKSL